MKLFLLNFSLVDSHLNSSSKYTETGSINVLAPDDISARDLFLTHVNNVKVFIHPQTKTLWPMEFTRAMILSSAETIKGLVAPIPKSDHEPIVLPPDEVKKVRRARGPNKLSAKSKTGKGIKATSSRRKK